jgi:hypothetical protein
MAALASMIRLLTSPDIRRLRWWLERSLRIDDRITAPARATVSRRPGTVKKHP